ncbi:MAG: hypothetical protein CH6_2539 [Candidatus Kapaibacterium sp.]|nr:MAG: hypothetical protein CH6_2539 [Candidatus Kapabacteria bacterium]
MKKMIFILGALFLALNLFAQNRISPRPIRLKEINFDTVRIYCGVKSDTFKLDQFLGEDTLYFDIDTLIKPDGVFLRQCYGGGGDRIGFGAHTDSALRINSYLDPFHRSANPDLNLVRKWNNAHNPGVLTVPRIDAAGSSYWTPFIFQSLQLEPILEYDDLGYPIIDQNDEDGSVFGWKNKNSDYVARGTGLDTHRLVVRRLNWSIFEPALILWNSNKGTFFRRVNAEDTTSVEVDSLYLTVNLRSLDSSFTGLSESDTVLNLRIKVIRLINKFDSRGNRVDPYPQYDTTYIKFDSLPSLANGAFITMRGTRQINNEWEFLGYELNMMRQRPLPTSFAITKGMLIPDTLGGDSNSITLSAHGIFYDTTARPSLCFDWVSKDSIENGVRYRYVYGIVDFDVEVYYYNNLDVAIDWIRLESGKARRVYRGKYDGWLSKYIKLFFEGIRKSQPDEEDTASYWNYWRNFFPLWAYDTVGLKVHRFFLAEELGPNFWGAYRYLNLLLDTLGTAPNGLPPKEPWKPYQAQLHLTGEHFFHATGFDNIILESSIGFDIHQAAPYIRLSGDPLNFFNQPWTRWGPQFLHLTSGYKGTFLMDNFDAVDQGKTRKLIENEPTTKQTINLNNRDFEIDILTDTLCSGYEHWKGARSTGYCFDNISDSSFRVNPDTVVKYRLPAVMKSPLYSFEFQLYQNYLQQSNILLFNRIKLYNYSWLSPFPWLRVSYPSPLDTTKEVRVWNRYTTTSVLINRPWTGEETRLSFYAPVLIGAKGLSFWHTGFEMDGRQNSMGVICQLYPSDTNALRNLPVDSIVYSPLLMGDYVRRGNNRDAHPYWDTTLNTFNLLDSAFNFEIMGIDSNHIYIGIMSNRAEMSKIFKWIDAIEDTLINLRLLSAFYKGANRYYIQDPKVTYSDTLLKIFVKLNSVKTRRIGDSSNFDSDSLKSFLLSLFAYGNDTLRDPETLGEDCPPYIPIVGSYPCHVETFYLGVLNPRTDPLVRTFDTIRNQQGEILYIDSSMKFYSTAEYDIGVRYGNYTHIWNPSDTSYQRRDTSYWQSLWWKRQGAREITIPLQIEGITTPNVRRNALYFYSVVVQELGAQDTNLNKEFWRQPKYYHKVDTLLVNYERVHTWKYGGYSYIYHKDYNLKVRLLPGEGKILKVSIYRNYLCDWQARGDLPYIHQTKLITHSIEIGTRWTRDSLYRHLVYHRKDSLTGRSKIYYRRSYPVMYDSTTRITAWSPEVCLSDSIRCWREPERIITNADCAYPSLVVRYDSVSEKTKVYVTFVCRDADSLSNFNDCLYSNEPRYNCPNGDYTVVAECIFDADDTVQTIQPALAIRWACGDDVATWGVPVVNASRYGNYYVWADSISGIVSGYKRPWESEFPNGFNFNMSSFKFSSNGIAINPSLTSYSRIFYDEDGTPIVWQEKDNAGSPYNVYYSLLKVDSSGFFVRHYLPTGVGNNNPSFVFNADSSIVELGLGSEVAEHPVIYRDVKDSLQPPGPEQILDLVAWGAQRTDTVGTCRFVRTITLQHFLNNREITSTSIKPRVSLHTDYTNFNLRYPVLSQGSSGTAENHQGPVVLETIVEDSCPSRENFEKKVLHIPYDYFVTESPYSELIHSGASLVQLSRRPFVSIQNDWWQNLRLLQKDSSIAEFCTSTRKFWRRQDEEPKPFVFFGFCDSTGVTSFTNILLDGTSLKWNVKDIYPELDSVRRYRFIPYSARNVFSTEWFQAKDLSALSFVVNKTSNNPFSITLERQSDRRRTSLPIGLDAGYKVRNITYQLLNRTPEEKYRIIVARNTPEAQFCQEIILMPDPFAEENISRETNNDVPVLDLGSMEVNTNTSNNIQILVYPNPVDEQVYITSLLPIKYLKTKDKEASLVRINIYNSIGNKIYGGEIPSGSTFAFSTTTLPSGLYYIIATKMDYGVSLSGNASFFISK